MADMTERLAAARKKAEALKSEIAKAQNDKKDCSINDAAAKKDLKNLGPGLKARRVLKGHFGKVYAMHWSGDNSNLVSASQVRCALRVCMCSSECVLRWQSRGGTYVVCTFGLDFFMCCCVRSNKQSPQWLFVWVCCKKARPWKKKCHAF